MTTADEDATIYKVVLNDEEQYSIWPADRENPNGWHDAGPRGPKRECLAYIDRVWTDMRPLSLRRRMAETATAPEPRVEPGEPQPTRTGDELVDRLSDAEHPVEVGARSLERLREGIANGYVTIRFTGTQGGTALGVTLERDRTDLARADFERGVGVARLVGSLVLNGVPVRCLAEVDLGTLTGRGRLEPAPGP